MLMYRVSSVKEKQLIPVISTSLVGAARCDIWSSRVKTTNNEQNTGTSLFQFELGEKKTKYLNGFRLHLFGFATPVQE